MAYRKLKLWLLALLMVFGLVSGNAPAVSAASVHSKFYCEHNSVFYSCECSSDSSGDANYKSTSGGGGCGEDNDDSKANADQVWGYFVNQFMSAGYSKDEAEKATAGIMGNWKQESGFNPYRDDGQGCAGAAGPISGEIGLGIAQWCGSRQQDLADFAAERGKEYTCLSVQMEFTWKEMQDRDLIAKMKGLTPGESSHIFDKIFEVSEGSGEREAKGEALYQEYTGKDPGTIKDSSSPSDSPGKNSEGCPQSTSYSGGPIPSADCAELQKKMAELKDTRIFHEGDWVQKDIDRCTNGPIERCGSEGGAHPNTLRGITAASENAGVDSIKVWNINSIHGCDKFDHPVGLATDIGECGGTPATNDNSEECKKVFDYFIAHAQELNVKYIIWDGAYCNEKAGNSSGVNVSCNGDHYNHIHVSFNGDGAQGDDHHGHSH